MHGHALGIAGLLGGPLEELAGAVLVALAGSWMALLFHELGHVCAALLLGIRIWGLRLGSGPILWRGMIGGCRVHLAILPFIGSVQLLDEDACAIGYRDIVAGRWRFEWGPEAWRAPVISAAGGLSNLIGVLLLGACWQRAGQPAFGSPLGNLLLVAMASNFAGYLNLLPCFRSDGVHLLAHIRAARFRWQPVEVS
jgi:hypothetical protein